MRWQEVGRGSAHWMVERVEQAPPAGPAWRAACGPLYAESSFTHGRGRTCQGCKRNKAAAARAERRETNLPIIRAMHAAAAQDDG